MWERRVIVFNEFWLKRGCRRRFNIVVTSKISCNFLCGYYNYRDDNSGWPRWLDDGIDNGAAVMAVIMFLTYSRRWCGQVAGTDIENQKLVGRQKEERLSVVERPVRIVVVVHESPKCSRVRSTLFLWQRKDVSNNYLDKGAADTYKGQWYSQTAKER